MWLNQRLHGRRLLTMFFATTGALAIALAWMSWQLVRQDRALEVQRAQERREHAADLTVAALQKNLGQIEEELTGLSGYLLAVAQMT
jgi:peptidoglycan/LPS O-acetylase OafA/YrhL